MCGIAGIIGHKAGQEPDLLRRMCSSLSHRGPDGNGIWVSSNHQAVLVHTRLAIIDLREQAKQPMQHPQNHGLHITYNGEIYNYRELRKELEKSGYTFKTNSDTEVLLGLYHQIGKKMTLKLRGMFAFAIWDEHTQTCFLARDGFGVKPLYYTIKSDKLYFASELHTLQSTGISGSVLNQQAVVGYFRTGSVPEPMTLIEGTHCLPAGHQMSWNSQGFKMESFWKPQFQPTLMSRNDAIELTRSSLLDSIKHHFVSDVPVGIFLSGGIDSTALTALATVSGQNNLQTFSIGVDDPMLNEADLAKKTAEHFGTRHHTQLLDGQLAADRFATFVHHIDQPTIDGFNTYNVSILAREKGLKVVLSGLGGDELFGGYRSFQHVPKLAKLASCTSHIPGIACIGKNLEKHSHRKTLRRIGTLLQQKATLASAWTTYRGIFSLHDAYQLAAYYLNLSADNFPKETHPEFNDLSSLDTISLLELQYYMRNQLLKDSDVMSMSQGLELRVPLVDRVLFETLASIPASLRIAAGKTLLIDAVPEIPHWILNQKKRGFFFPYEKWLKQHWHPSFTSKRLVGQIQKSTWYQKWAVFMFEAWLTQRKIPHGK